MSQIDLALIHAPSVYDFRERAIMYGPISDLIPSSPVFEMYPLGFLTMASYLEERGLEVRIVNLALKMMNDRRFDVPAFLAKLRPKAFGIDLHWLPHAHGALEVAKMIKAIHPQTPIIFGGLSATYFHRELIDYPQVDYVLRGDAVEPPLYDLLTAPATGRPLDQVPNLTWKSGGQVRVNPHSFRPDTMDYVDLRPDRIGQMVLRYRDLEGVLPFNGWWQNPITAVFTVKGCAHGCITCGSSHSACALLGTRTQPAFRSSANLVKNMRDISRFSRGPIFLVGDLRQAGDAHAYEVLRLLRQAKIKNQIVFELFEMPPLDYLRAIDAAVQNWSLELSPESHDPALRRIQNEAVDDANAEMERVIQAALALRCHRIDVFFMIGLSGQTRESVMETVRYCEHLFQMSDKRLSCFISPMGPFLDPGSRGFEEPERYGYRQFARTLEEHRRLLVQPSWKQILSYETVWMDREEIVAATYDAGEALNALKMRYGRIDAAQGRAVAERIRQSRALKQELDWLEQGDAPDPAATAALQGEIDAFSVSTVCDKRELFWRRHLVNFRLRGILWMVGGYLADQARRLRLTP
ncbi:MAG: TIGR04190 family B12-binding domain/radical SAM domain protein [Caldilineaceae bacterium]|nr:TIGR04190 family B12-binding domain/radical SAM domain protein [Caldilineaceae bacterium]